MLYVAIAKQIVSCSVINSFAKTIASNSANSAKRRMDREADEIVDFVVKIHNDKLIF